MQDYAATELVKACRFDLWAFGLVDANWSIVHLLFPRHLCTAEALHEPTWDSTAEFISTQLPADPTPLILLPGFDISMIQLCQLHNLNLGLLWTANGSALLYLISVGYFGNPDPAVTLLKDLLEIAYQDFLAWASGHRVRHSQRKFTVGLVVKQSSGGYLTSKGHNSRVLVERLADTCLKAVRKEFSLPGRTFGKWILSQQADPAPDEFLVPTTVALTLACDIAFFSVECNTAPCDKFAGCVKSSR